MDRNSFEQGLWIVSARFYAMLCIKYVPYQPVDEVLEVKQLQQVQLNNEGFYQTRSIHELYDLL